MGALQPEVSEGQHRACRLPTISALLSFLSPCCHYYEIIPFQVFANVATSSAQSSAQATMSFHAYGSSMLFRVLWTFDVLEFRIVLRWRHYILDYA